MIRLTKTIQISTYHLADLFAKPIMLEKSQFAKLSRYAVAISTYRIAVKFGESPDSFQAFGERKFGELINQSIDYLANFSYISLANHG